MVSYNQRQYYNQQEAKKQQQHHFLAVKRPQQQPSKPSKKPPVTRQRPPTRVHIVEPIHFKELVQSLTSGWTQPQPQPQPQQSSSPDCRLQSNIDPPPPQLQGCHRTIDSRVASSKSTTALGDGDHYGFDSVGELGATTELTLSPNFHTFMGSFPMLSPGPLSHFGA